MANLFKLSDLQPALQPVCETEVRPLPSRFDTWRVTPTAWQTSFPPDFEASLVTLTTAIEARDPFTHQHVQRVMQYSVAIAEMMEMTKAQRLSVQLGSILHDIGKIFIPDRVLFKPGNLTFEERDLMQQHVTYGAALVANSPLLSPAIPVIRHHHERWDGLGYPDRLSGENIPLAARVVMLADAYDAITSHRVYRRALEPKAAYEEILSGSGTMFDPKVVEAFSKVWQAEQPCPWPSPAKTIQ